MRRFLLLLLLLTGCTTLDVSTPEPLSLWGRVYTVAQVPQSDAAAMWADDDRIVLAWLQPDGVMLRSLLDGQLPVLLPFPLNTPYNLKIKPGIAGSTHLFWMDTNGEGEPRLFSAFVTADLQLERGPIEVSKSRVESYDVLVSGEGVLWVVWSGHLPSERSLFANRVDALGRPRQSQFLIENADRPVFVQDALFWIQNQQVYRAHFEDGSLTGIAYAGENVPLAAGDWLVNFAAAADAAHTYYFWNVLHVDGTARTWFSTGGKPVPLTVGAASTTPFQTGFNSGSVYAVGAGELAVKWAAPLSGQFEVLPVAAQVGQELRLLYFKEGTVAASQTLTTLDSGLVGLPALTTNIDRHLFLGWAHPVSTEHADLLLTATRS